MQSLIKKIKIKSYFWKSNLIPALLIIILMLPWKLGKQLWLWLISLSQWHLCFYISVKPKISVFKPWRKQLRKLLRATCIMKTISSAYLSNHEFFVQEVVYHILPELKLRRICPAMHFLNTNLLEERARVLLPEKNFWTAGR